MDTAHVERPAAAATTGDDRVVRAARPLLDDLEVDVVASRERVPASRA